jgi:glycine/D-amino acid oxidase-like deaminating enzyme
MTNGTMPLPASLYAATVRPAQLFPPLQESRRADVVIVGAGFTGLSTALHLAEAGANVVVLEANEPGWGASGRNGGQINPGLKMDPDQVIADFGADRGERLVRFAWATAETTFALIRRLGIECDARQGGTLRAAYQFSHAKAIERSAKQGIRHGLPVQLLDSAEVREATGSDRYLAAMRDTSGGDLQPLDYARGLAASAARAGAAIYGASPVRSIVRNGDRWSVATPVAEVSAEFVILATNGYTDDLRPALRRSIVPVYSSIVSSAPLPSAIAERIMPSRSVLYESGNITIYLRVDKDGRLLMGGRGPQYPLSDASQLGYLADYAQRLWPFIGRVTWEKAWNGQLAMTKDHYPHIHEIEPGLVACLGCNGRGVALLTAMGGELAKFALGRDAHALALPLTPVKPIAFHAFWRAGVAAKIMEGRVRDRLGL